MIGRYLATHHGIADAAWTQRLEENPDWSVQLQEALGDPTGFEEFVSATVAALGEERTPTP